MGIERRSWQLWMISLTVMCSVTFGFTLLLYPVLEGYAEHLHLGRRGLPQLVYGLVVLVILTGVYTVLKQRELNALRNYIIASYASSGGSEDDYLHDSLTGALDRSVLPELLKDQSERADQVNGPFSVVILDIYGFGRINEREGNLVGDLVLKEFSMLLQRTVRHSDSVLRYGPDEFLCLLAGSPRQGAEIFVRRVEKGWERTARLRGFTFTTGVSEYRTGANPEEVLADAEANLAKAAPRSVSATASFPSG